MAQFTSLIQEIIPNWLRRRSHKSGDTLEPPRSEDADAVWRKVVEKDLFGANTSDYAETEEESRGKH
ncbi:hypothetical protein FJ930_19075 [Mesorhizobium sp. B2-4-15]|uniref:hypothetical protein n=1 Tax=Mesorhizobium sp. B2-4-15 TaxID=2589934 RepID=UPI0011527F6B|nr:hypothetical protein [Mesorhizobium sp. B2-4-15]TPK70420.1 hypothetical protein FJ930_19075 [Mesorhizobium sp. B2-4-15]